MEIHGTAVCGELRSEARAVNAEQDSLLCARPGGHPADVRCHSCPQEPQGAGRREPLGGAAPGAGLGAKRGSQRRPGRRRGG